MANQNYFMGLDGFVWFVGVVEDRNDPDQLGRVLVRCLGFNTENLVSLPTSDFAVGSCDASSDRSRHAWYGQYSIMAC